MPHDLNDARIDACPHCARPVPSRAFDDVQAVCRYCGGRLQREPRDPWTDVARVTNLAEAGFLTDELIGLGIDARIHQVEEFSAVTNRWGTMFLIRVPSDLAREAAARIRMHLADEAEEADAGAIGFRFSADEEAVEPPFFRPVALIVLAGVASFMLGQRFSEQNVERRPPRGSLATAVGAIGRPFVTEPTPGRPQYRLSLDAGRQLWYLDTDRDGDGVYDSRHQFRAPATAW